MWSPICKVVFPWLPIIFLLSRSSADGPAVPELSDDVPGCAGPQGAHGRLPGVGRPLPARRRSRRSLPVRPTADGGGPGVSRLRQILQVSSVRKSRHKIVLAARLLILPSHILKVNIKTLSILPSTGILWKYFFTIFYYYLLLSICIPEVISVCGEEPAV